MSTKQASTRVSPEELKTLIKQVNDYFDQIKKIYVGRESVIDRVKYAMLQKAHVLCRLKDPLQYQYFLNQFCFFL